MSFQIQEMFNRISNNYDRLNRLITFKMYLKWRKNVFNIVESQKPHNILDVATGTGDMPILYSKLNVNKIIGIDISEGMLKVAREKINKLKIDNIINLQFGDAEALKFEDNSFDVVSVAYGIRNFENLNKGLSEIFRVLKPKGKFIILETSVPSNFIYKKGYLFYTKKIIPLLGKLFSNDRDAYSYLSTSAINFPYGLELKSILEKVGFCNIDIIPQSKGISTIYVASKK